MHFTRPSRVGSGLAWSGLQLATLSVDSTHIKIDGRQQCLCLCLCLYECIYVCVQSLERHRAGAKRGREGKGASVCRKMLIAQLKSLTMSKAPSRARRSLLAIKGSLLGSLRFGSGLGFGLGLGLLCSRYAAEDRLTKAPN